MDRERTQRSATLEDDFGGAHEYRMFTFPPDEGFDLLPDVVNIVVTPLGAILEALGSSDDEAEGFELASLLGSSIDGPKIADAINAFAKGIATAGGSRFCQRLLKHVERDGSRIGDSKGFNDAFKGGNYGELFAALAWVLKENYTGVFARLGKDLGIGSR